MKQFIPVLLLQLLIIVGGVAQSFPYDIQLESFTISGLPGIHSFAAGESNGKWLIISGRVDGMHRGGGGATNPAFPSTNSNTNIYVVDPVAEVTWSTSISSLSTALQNQMSSTNTNFYQDGSYLYVVGGYGQDNAGNHITYGYITAIDIPSIINNIINGNAITGDFIQLADNRMTIAGGQLGKIGNTFYLVGGMELQERYTQSVNPIYSSEIRKFEIVNNGTTLTISNYVTVSDPEFHRRDYNLIAQIFPDLSTGYMISSGVFTTAGGVFYNPIEVKSSGYTVIPEATFKQEFSHYQSGKLALYNPTDNEMHSLFFGGIAQYYYDSNGNKIDDSDVPFVKTISRVSKTAAGAYSESVFSTEMPVLVGAGSELFLEENIALYSKDIIDMDQLSGSPITVGYIFGGIETPSGDVFPNNVASSSASATIYRVNLVSTALPIKLVDFRGELTDDINCATAEIILTWKTLSEENSDRFEIERGKYGNFNKVGSIPTQGQSITTQSYHFTDTAPLKGKVYYRLKMIDMDGSFKYSNIITLEGCNETSLEITPNPTKGSLFISGDTNDLAVKVFDTSGKEYPAYTQKVNDGIHLDLRQFPDGIYYIKTNNNETYKIVKQ